MKERHRIVGIAKRTVAAGLIMATNTLAPDSYNKHYNNPDYSISSTAESEIIVYPNAHERFEAAMESTNVVIASAYGTPIDGYGTGAGWGSLHNGLNEENYDAYENYNQIMSYITELVTSEPESLQQPAANSFDSANQLSFPETNIQEIYYNADVVIAYGTDNLIYIPQSIAFAEELYKQGGTATLNIRPPAFYSVEDLDTMIKQIYSGELKDNEGNVIVPLDFIQRTHAPLSLDLEAMLGGHPGGISAVELSKVFKTYKEIMAGFGITNPALIMYERGIGEGSADMVDNPKLLDSEGVNLIITYYGFVKTGSLENKVQATVDMVQAYGRRRGGCMAFEAWYLQPEHRDGLNEPQNRKYFLHPVCGLLMFQ